LNSELETNKGGDEECGDQIKELEKKVAD